MIYNGSMNYNKPVILASGSPRRLEILRDKGIEPIVCPSDIEEVIPCFSDVSEIPAYLAELKAGDVFKNTEFEDGVIIGADTIVCLDKPGGESRIMGKPADFEEGFEMLSALRDKTHRVITGVCMIDVSTGFRKVFTDTTFVTFGYYSDEELREYLLTDEAYDKAGAYAIQGTFGKYISRIEGSYYNVMGFPWEKIEKELLTL